MTNFGVSVTFHSFRFWTKLLISFLFFNISFNIKGKIKKRASPYKKKTRTIISTNNEALKFSMFRIFYYITLKELKRN